MKKGMVAVLIAVLSVILAGMIAVTAVAGVNYSKKETADNVTATEPVVFEAAQLQATPAEMRSLPEYIGAGYNPKFVQQYGGVLYFVDVQEVEDDEFTVSEHTIYAMDAAGTVQQIGEPRRYYQEYYFADEEYSYIKELTQYNGYTDMTVYKDHIYFVGTDDTPGSYSTYSTMWNNGEEIEYASTYAGTACIYRMDLDGSNMVKLIPGLGNGYAHMAIANDRIAVSSCYLNNFYVYDLVDFMFYDLEGNFIEKYESLYDPSENFAYMDGAQFNLIVLGIETDGKDIYASVGDSEGDFASSRLIKVPDVRNELLLEAYFVPSVVKDGAIIYFTSNAADTFWEEGMENHLTLRKRAGGEETILAYIPARYTNNWNEQLYTIGDMVYFASDEVMLRVPISGGPVMRLENGAFVEAVECNPEYYNYSASSVTVIGGTDGPTAIYIAETDAEESTEEEIIEEAEPLYFLPDSDTRIYTRAELEVYDTATLGFMRNEILARHGYPFKTEKYRDHFSVMPWYTRNENFAYSMLNSVEMENVETIKAIEESR